MRTSTRGFDSESTRAEAERQPLQAKWRETATAAHYAQSARGRWRSPRAAGKDVRLVTSLLQRNKLTVDRALDVPCGSGRLSEALLPSSGQILSFDSSRSMLLQARITGAQLPQPPRLAQARAEALPLAADSCDLVLCCRLLHHLNDGEELESIVGELVRVSSAWIIASYWDCASLEAITKGLRRPRPGGTRRARPAAVIDQAFAAAGALVCDRIHARRLLSPQTFVLAHKEKSATRG